MEGRLLIRLSRHVPVIHSSQVADARRAALQCAMEAGLGETSSGHAALVATELATNLLKHAEGGAILVGLDESQPRTVAIVSIDRGRGLVNLAAAMQDGFSTAGSAGTGLGAVQRASSTFDVYAVPGHGTTVLCRVGEGAGRSGVGVAAPRMTVGGICVPKHTEEQAGDAWVANVGRDVVTITVADGLGHGPAAATASSAAMRIVSERPDDSVERMLQDAHGGLRPTRGAAVAISRIHLSAGRADFAGVGNIAGTIITDESMRKMVSLPGIVGHEMRRAQSFSYPWLASSVLVMQSDGVSASWNAAHYPGLMQHEPALIAAVLYRDHCRGNDDATVVVARAT